MPTADHDIGREENSPKRSDGWARWTPGLLALQIYRREWFVADIMAGLALAMVLVPVGVAYAVASGLPGINGLYATIIPLIIYAIFGPSRILVLGPDSSLAAVILGVVLPLSAGDPSRAVALAGAMAIVSGLLCIVAGVARLGFVTELLSKPIRYGYMNGIALTVLASQIPKLLGVPVGNDGIFPRLRAVVEAIATGALNWVSLAVGLGVLATILALGRYRRFPAVLIAVAAATLIADGLDLGTRAGLDVLGALPRGLPNVSVPWIEASDLSQVFFGGCAIAVISLADTSVLSRAYAARLGNKVDSNQEAIGLGAANLAAGFFHGFPVSSSSSRTPVAEAAGARSQLAGVVGALAVALLIVFAPNLLSDLPSAALAAVVIASAIGLIEVRDLLRIHRIQAWEFWLSLVCTAGVFAFGAIQGITLAIVAAVIEFLWDAWRPYSAVLGRTPDVRGFHDIRRYPEAQQIPGLVLLRWDAPLFFANADIFRQRVLEVAAAAPTQTRWVVVAAEPVTSIDVTASDILAELHVQLEKDGTKLGFAELKDPVKDKARRFGLLSEIGEDMFFPTIGAAVDSYVRLHGIEV